MTSFTSLIVALIAVWSISEVTSECPNINDLPVLNEDGTGFYCAWTWGEWGDSMPIHGCNGGSGFMMDGYDCTSRMYILWIRRSRLHGRCNTILWASYIS